jgi:hypothetical protein
MNAGLYRTYAFAGEEESLGEEDEDGDDQLSESDRSDQREDDCRDWYVHHCSNQCVASEPECSSTSWRCWYFLPIGFPKMWMM